MNLYPTNTTRTLVLVAVIAVIVAALSKEPIAMIWMGSILVGTTLVRAIASFKVAAARRQGFEMHLASSARKYNVTRTEPFELEIALRNQSDLSLQVRDLRVLCSPSLEVHVNVNEAQIAAHSSLNVKLVGKATRVGYGTIHGLFLRLLHSSGAFEAPLVFFNPIQFIAYPATTARAARPSGGGLSRHPSDADRSGRMSGDSIELRELRAHQPGDALRKIAWKASARRGTLLVRDEELMERQTLWVLLDASTELWGGEVGKSPLDEGVDRVASVLHKYVALGDRVGLGVLSSRILFWTKPDKGLSHWMRMRSGLVMAAQLWDADRSGCDELDTARIVFEHLSRLDPSTVRNVAASDIDRIAAIASNILERYELEVPDAYAAQSRERQLRKYAATFGLSLPPRLEAERWQTDNQLLLAIDQIVTAKPSRIIVCSVEPTTSFLQGLTGQRRKMAQRRVRLSWLALDPTAGMPDAANFHQRAVNDSLAWQAWGSKYKSLARLKRAGIGIEPLPPLRSRLDREESP